MLHMLNHGLADRPDVAQPAKQAVSNDLIRTVCREEGATLIDVDAHMRSIDQWDEADRFFYDGLHLNDAGSKVVAKVIADGLRRPLDLGDVKPFTPKASPTSVQPPPSIDPQPNAAAGLEKPTTPSGTATPTDPAASK